MRKVYNLALSARAEAWARRERVNYAQTSAMLTMWKQTAELAYLGEVSCVPLQQALRHLQSAFAAFWGKRSRYPRFKSKRKSRASAEYTRSAFRFRNGELTLAKMADPLRVIWSRPLPDGAEPTTVTVSRDSAGRWFVSVLFEDTPAPLPPATRAVGIDAGLTSLVTLSTGEKITNDRWFPSSKLCSACGAITEKMPLSMREWMCAHCGTTHDRDENAATNLLTAGLAAAACGAGVSPRRESSRPGQCAMKQETPPARVGSAPFRERGEAKQPTVGVSNAALPSAMPAVTLRTSSQQ